MSLRLDFRRTQRRRGSAVVEFALVWLPIGMLLFGVAGASRMIFMRNMMQSAVQEAVRSAITYQLHIDQSGCATQTGCIKYVVKKNSLGFLNGTVGGRDASDFIHVSYYTPDRLSTPATAHDLPKNVDGVSIRQLNQPGNLVEVRVDNYPVNWMLPLPASVLNGTALVFSVAASDVLQALPAGMNTPPEP